MASLKLWPVQVAFWHTAEMARPGCVRFGCRFRRRAAGLWACGVGLAVGLWGSLLGAQDGATPTLHVYTDLIQIPVLVLDINRGAMGPIAGSRFKVSLDDGPKFRVTHVRPEGDDPISLSILLDVSGFESELMPKIDMAIAGLAPLSLNARDHVSVYALDCSLIRSSDDVAAEPGELKRAVDEALQSWTDRRGHRHGADCEQPVHLWDALTLVTHALSSLPGRRVILAVTEGYDRKSQHSWNEVRTYAQASGVAIFGLSYVPDETGLLRFLNIGMEDAFNSVCELSGGVVFRASRRTVADELKRFTTMLRGRYIVEFPRPLHSTAGAHILTVTIDKSDAVIRSAGISVPIADPAVLADPMTVPADPSRTPELGKRRILTAPR